MMLDVQQKSFQACMQTLMDSTNTRMDTIVKDMTRELTSWPVHYLIIPITSLSMILSYHEIIKIVVVISLFYYGCLKLHPIERVQGLPQHVGTYLCKLFAGGSSSVLVLVLCEKTIKGLIKGK